MAESVSIRMPVIVSYIVCRDPGRGSIHIQRFTRGGWPGAHTVYASPHEFELWKRMIRVRAGVLVGSPTTTEMPCGCEIPAGQTREADGRMHRAWSSESEGRLRGMVLRCQQAQSEIGSDGNSVPGQRETDE